jgi:hypothetical protein
MKLGVVQQLVVAARPRITPEECLGSPTGRACLVRVPRPVGERRAAQRMWLFVR